MTHHTEAERADCPACGGKPFIRRSHDADGMRWSHVECKGCGLRTRGKWVASSSDECPIFFQEVWEEWPRRAPAPQAQHVPLSGVMNLVSEWGMASHANGEAALDAHNPDATPDEIAYADECVQRERAAWTAIEDKLRAHGITQEKQG